MAGNKKNVKRYADSELAEFKTLIEQKLERAKRENSYYQEQIFEITERFNEDHSDWTEGAIALSDLELLNDLVQRQRKYIHQLEMALTRILQKTYGICEITGELIDKRRLYATPTTTKSLAVKNDLHQKKIEKKI